MAENLAPSGQELSTRMTVAWIRALGIYHVLLAILLFHFLFEFWPAAIGAGAVEGTQTVAVLFGRLRIELNPERQLLMLVALAGALGSYVHAATSFVNFTGTRSIVASWRWWYGLRPFIGMSLALGFYFAVRAGFFSVSASTKDLNLIGFVATAFLVGMFTKQATQKLSELFDVLFRVPADEKPQKDRLSDTPEAPAAEQSQKDR